MDNDNRNNNLECGQSRFLKKIEWNRVTRRLAVYGVMSGIFHCKKDPFFCLERGWLEPQLVLGMVKYDQLRQPRESVEFYYFNNCQMNSISSIFKWLESTLRNRLISSDSDSLKNSNDKHNLKVFYHQTTEQIPLYFSAISVKFSRRAQFHYLSKNNTLIEKLCKKNKNTPIYVISSEHKCYQYGSNLNELPNYAHFSLFLTFLHPDMNHIFLFSFLILNLFLFMIFFVYNESLLRQILRGLIYSCIFNFVLFSMWLLTMNSNSKAFTSINSITNNLLYQARYVLMYNNSTQKILAHFRFIFFYYIYVKPLNALIFYLFISVLFYMHSKHYCSQLKTATLTSDFNKKTKNLRLSLLEKKESSSNFNLREIESNESTALSSSIVDPTIYSSQIPNETLIDIEMSVSEIINQINGPTTIWLQSSSRADRLVNELPSIEYCKCFFVNSIRTVNYDETDCGETTEEEENLSHTTKENSQVLACECGKNIELKKYFNENELLNFWIKFNKECSICLTKYKYNCIILVMPCGHSFHKFCIYEWFMNSINYKLSCPICRAHFFKKTI